MRDDGIGTELPDDPVQPHRALARDLERIVVEIEAFEFDVEQFGRPPRLGFARALDRGVRGVRFLPEPAGLAHHAERQADDLHVVPLGAMAKHGARGTPDEIARVRRDDEQTVTHGDPP